MFSRTFFPVGPQRANYKTEEEEEGDVSFQVSERKSGNFFLSRIFLKEQWFGIAVYRNKKLRQQSLSDDGKRKIDNSPLSKTQTQIVPAFLHTLRFCQ